MIRPMYYEYGFEAIHADWPCYPAGHGCEIALFSLCFFPSGTHFEVVDEIDQCLLLMAREYMHSPSSKDLFSPQHFHVAIWHEDLLQMRDAEWVDGFYIFETGDQYRSFILAEYVNKLPDPLKKKNIEFINTVDDSKWLERAQKANQEINLTEYGLSVTEVGWTQIDQIIDSEKISVTLRNRTDPLAKIGYYDAAVRDAAILLESAMRNAIGSTHWGLRLIDEFYDNIKDKFGDWAAIDLTLRNELRAIFKFTRNEFAHNFVEISEERYNAIIFRISRALVFIEQIADELRSLR